MYVWETHNQENAKDHMRGLLRYRCAFYTTRTVTYVLAFTWLLL